MNLNNHTTNSFQLPTINNSSHQVLESKSLKPSQQEQGHDPLAPDVWKEFESLSFGDVLDQTKFKDWLLNLSLDGRVNKEQGKALRSIAEKLVELTSPWIGPGK
jgi:hypothetical protein